MLTCRPRRVTVRLDQSRDLHVELPLGVTLGEPDVSDAAAARVRAVEGGS